MRTIPSSGEKVPAIGLGSWLTFAIDLDDEDELSRRVAILREFLNLGGGLLDSSPMYGVAEKVIGTALKRIGRQKEFVCRNKSMDQRQSTGISTNGKLSHLMGLASF